MDQAEYSVNGGLIGHPYTHLVEVKLNHATHLKVILQVDEKWEVYGRENPLLVQGVLHLLQFHHFLLIQDLHGTVAFTLFVLDQHHTSKGTCSESLETLKVH